mgnify:CR=1 FL=1
MESSQYDIVIIGGGILGLSTAMQLLERAPQWRVAVVEKEEELATHQTGHNSGVMHSGIYRSEEHTSELQSRRNLVCRLLLEKKKNKLLNLIKS